MRLRKSRYTGIAGKDERIVDSKSGMKTKWGSRNPRTNKKPHKKNIKWYITRLCRHNDVNNDHFFTKNHYKAFGENEKGRWKSRQKCISKTDQ